MYISKYMKLLLVRANIRNTTMSKVRINAFAFGLQLCALVFSLVHCDARRSTHFLRGHKNVSPTGSNVQKSREKIVVSRHLDVYGEELDDVSSDIGPNGVGSPFTIPPYDSLPPVYWPDQTTPPFCLDSPFTPLPPGGGSSSGGYTPLPPPSSSSNPTPTFPSPTPPSGPGGPDMGPNPSNPGTGSSPSNPGTGPSPLNPGTGSSPSNPGSGSSPSNPGTGTLPSNPGSSPSNPGTGSSPLNPGGDSTPPGSYTNPPIIIIPAPTEPGLSPPYNYGPSPPTIVIPRPPSNTPPPSIFIPSPPVFQPPIVFPPPAVPPPPKSTHSGQLWCVAKPTVPDPIIQEAMDYACGSGGECESIQASGSCFQPNTLYAHASYAFNSYWQRTKVAGGTCDFGRTAMLVTVDPSHDGCHFVYF